MSHAQLEKIIEAAFEDRANVTPATKGEVRDAVNEALNLLDSGQARVAQKVAGKSGPEAWAVNQWLKKAVLLSFRLNDMWAISGGPGGASTTVITAPAGRASFARRCRRSRAIA